MTTDDRLFSLIRRISAIESQMVTRRSFLGSTDAVGSRYYRELQKLRHELDVRLGYGTHGTAMGENRADVSTPRRRATSTSWRCRGAVNPSQGTRQPGCWGRGAQARRAARGSAREAWRDGIVAVLKPTPVRL